VTATVSTEERLVLSTAAGKQKAFSMVGVSDPCPKVSPSLLSSDDIDRYVLETGLICPYYEGGGRKKRLKKASYEGRIGSTAWVYDSTSNQLTDIWKEEELVVPPNTIVFVECDLEFRLPPYIALRFNLQIRHVHRGLLLGTGPLVDPGFWGKLCIPLHNLTNEEYVIPRKEGLIWVEFTKTTPGDKLGRNPLSMDEDDDTPKHPDHGWWDVRKFITKAAQPFDPSKKPIPIQSSIKEQTRKAQASADEAADRAKHAQEDAADAKLSAEKSEKASQDVKTKVENYGLIGATAAVLTVMAIWASFFFGVRADISALDTRVDALVADGKDKAKPDTPPYLQLTTEERLSSDIEGLRRQLDQVVHENAALKLQVQSLSVKP
jgi:deoxycytidine triphosphate deaminase